MTHNHTSVKSFKFSLNGSMESPHCVEPYESLASSAGEVDFSLRPGHGVAKHRVWDGEGGGQIKYVEEYLTQDPLRVSETLSTIRSSSAHGVWWSCLQGAFEVHHLFRANQDINATSYFLLKHQGVHHKREWQGILSCRSEVERVKPPLPGLEELRRSRSWHLETWHLPTWKQLDFYRLGLHTWVPSPWKHLSRSANKHGSCPWNASSLTNRLNYFEYIPYYETLRFLVLSGKCKQVTNGSPQMPSACKPSEGFRSCGWTPREMCFEATPI